ncbi:hypothetical protein A2482_00470 [Candidatus Falkowbacteria bacterium RIFOXYC2_FULL_48_21]|uniref:Rod shape-determining protein MreD n=1 Tax=Candidatus Falkowbacteria bacterium RIFOXYC2_FULL_48_21 TaxID=1798005 RepID=A0A1F5TFP5_9BACT|nr:MAG: hypothetical protein A2482_00470 [Candidatus Falkowbacteria bacterium RIFOXYC2_FULL_48_21]
MKKAFYYFLAVMGVFAYELAVAPFMPFGMDKMNVWLVAVVFVAVAFQFYQGVVIGLVSAFLFELYSVLPFGAIMIAAGITLSAVYLVYQRFLTNKSLYATLMLTALATLVYSLVIFVYTAARYFAKTNDVALVYRLGRSASGDFVIQMVMHLALVSFLFLIFHASSRRFGAAFIDTIKT